MTLYRFEKRFLIPLWSLILPVILVANLLFIIIYEFSDMYISNHDGKIYFNIVALFSIIYLGGWVLNVIILAPIMWIKGVLHDKYLDKHPEKCVSAEQLAQDFENLAKVLREEDKEKKDERV